jgi:hypothetical protein
MTSYRGHLFWFTLVLAFALLTLMQYKILENFSSVEVLVAIGIGYLYCLLPDVDSRASKVRAGLTNVFLVLTLIVLGVYLLVDNREGYLYAAIVLTLIQLGFWKLKHRGFTHQLTFGLGVSLPLAFISPIVAGFGLMGFLTHLITD